MPPRASHWERFWAYGLDLFLTVWVLRVPVAGVAVGFLLLGLPQTEDLLVDVVTDGLRTVVVFFAGLILVWALPTHYAARLLAETDERYAARILARAPHDGWIIFLQQWMPRLLGMLTFGAMLFGVWRSHGNLPDVAEAGYTAAVARHLQWLAWGIGAALVLFVIYTVARRAWFAESRIVQRAEALAGRVLPRLPRLPRLAASSGRAGQSALGPLLLFILFFLFAFLPLFAPRAFALLFPRASAVPFILGGWMPLLAYLAGLGRRLQVPLVTIAVSLTFLLPLFLGDNYEVRRISAADTLKDLRAGTDAAAAANLRNRVALAQAVTWWKGANPECSDPTKTCRPIIVAASGGASRAGFFTASLIGRLLDDRVVGDDGRGHGLGAAAANRIFAISSVSGSSVGAVMTVAALAAAKEGKQPCTKQTDSLWFADGTRPIADWQSCLEALNAGDFLTPVFTGFVFRDTLRFLGYFEHSAIVRRLLGPWSSRGTLLEGSWEDRFADLVGRRESGPNDPPCLGELTCPFTSLRPTDKRWLPLLLLNGTSVASGQRIVTSVLAAQTESTDCPLEPREHHLCTLFADAPLFHDMLAATPRHANEPPGDDIRLSTAAHNSARFPLLSPPGEIRNADGEVIDQIVDGGYFENYGVQTAMELALAIRAIDDKLRPFILVLSNDPELAVSGGDRTLADTNAAAKPTHLFRIPGIFLPDVMGPLKAFAHVRDARGALALDDAAAALDRGDTTACNLTQIRVWAEPSHDDPKQARELSMSWWLSKPVQRYLHEQIAFADPAAGTANARNKPYAVQLLNALRPAGAAAPGSPAIDCPD